MSTRQWDVYDERTNSTGTYYTLTVPTKGEVFAPVTVKLSKHGKFVCLTHMTADQCEHSQFVKQYVAQHRAA